MDFVQHHVPQTGGASAAANGLRGRVKPGEMFTIRNLLIVIALLQVVIVVFVLFPPSQSEQNLNKAIVGEVSQLTTVNPFENPAVTVIADADALRGANEIQGLVYANSQNGDYVLGYSDKMIVYRRQTRQVIYEGDSPGTILNKNQQALAEKITTLAKEKKLLANDVSEQPELRVVSDTAALKQANSKFYNDAKRGDVVAVYATAGIILIYRPGDVSIVNSGKFTTNIDIK